MSLEKTLQEIKSKSDNIKRNSFHELVGTAASFINVPVGLSILTIGEIYSKYDKKCELDKTPMSDEWLKEVRKSDFISSEGLEFLISKIDNKGYVSVNDASEWMDFEETFKKDGLKQDLTFKGSVVSFLLKAYKQTTSVVSKEYIASILDMLESRYPVKGVFLKGFRKIIGI